MKNIKLYEDFINESSFNIVSKKDGNYENAELIVEITAGNTGYVGTVKGTYGKEQVNATLFYGYDDGAQFLDLEDKSLDEDIIDQLVDIIANDPEFIKNTPV